MNMSVQRIPNYKTETQTTHLKRSVSAPELTTPEPSDPDNTDMFWGFDRYSTGCSGATAASMRRMNERHAGPLGPGPLKPPDPVLGAPPKTAPDKDDTPAEAAASSAGAIAGAVAGGAVGALVAGPVGEKVGELVGGAIGGFLGLMFRRSTR